MIKKMLKNTLIPLSYKWLLQSVSPSTARRFTMFLMVSFSLQVLVACGPEVESRKVVHADLKEIMAKRELAIESKDLEAYKKLFFTEYLDGGVTYQILMDDMQNQFANNDKIEFNFEKNPMNFKMNTARMVSMVSYKTESMKKPVFHHEKTLFRRVDGKWYISGGVAVALF